MSPESSTALQPHHEVARGLPTFDGLDLAGKRVLLRLDLDVPGAHGEPEDHVDTFGLEPAVRAIAGILEKGARPIVLAHAGDPQASARREPSLESVAARLSELGGWEIFLPDDCLSDAAKKVTLDLRDGQVCVLENLRFQPGEQQNDEVFAQRLGGYGDAYVNDAPRASLGEHASVALLPRMVRESALGPTFCDELRAVGRVLGANDKRVGLVVGGAGLAEQLELLEALLPRLRVLSVGGGAATTLLKARGMDVGASDVEPKLLARGRTLVEQAQALDVELLLPVDLRWQERDVPLEHVVGVGTPGHGTIVDVGPRSLELFERALGQCTTLVFCGDFARPSSPARAEPSSSTRLVGALARAGRYTLVAGDDLVRRMHRAGVAPAGELGYAARGGPATLALLCGKSLPGIEALKRAQQVGE